MCLCIGMSMTSKKKSSLYCCPPMAKYQFIIQIVENVKIKKGKIVKITLIRLPRSNQYTVLWYILLAVCTCLGRGVHTLALAQVCACVYMCVHVCTFVHARACVCECLRPVVFPAEQAGVPQSPCLPLAAWVILCSPLPRALGLTPWLCISLYFFVSCF